MFSPACISPWSIAILTDVWRRISRRCVSINTRSPRCTARSMMLVAMTVLPPPVGRT
jgi:hypothetical protein